MSRYIVYVDVEVEADSAEEAEALALGDIRNDSSLEWSVSDVTEVDE